MTIYGKEYFLKHQYGNDPKRQSMYAQEIARLKDKFPDHMRGGTILDIGCGVGDWQAHLHGSWMKYAVEPDTYAAEFARNNCPSKIIDLTESQGFGVFDRE